MQKAKVFLSRLLLVLLLVCSIAPTVSVAPQTPFTITAEAAYNKATVKKVQQALNKQGYDCGTPDGIMGKKTKAAIKEYQADHDLKVTGTINSKLLKSLNVKAVKDTAKTSSSKKKTSPANENKEVVVYITDTGSKYHRSGCRYLKKSKHSISLSDAKDQGYTPCSVCKP